MNTIRYILKILLCINALVNVIDCKQYAAHTRRRCIPELNVAWNCELTQSPLVASPLITDVDMDGELDIIVASFDGEVHVVQGKNGLNLRNAMWPYRLSNGFLYANPLQYDVNHDGLLDILVCSSSGQLIFLDNRGQPITSLELKQVAVKRNWWSNVTTAVGHNSINNYVFSRDEQQDSNSEDFVFLNPHILSTPVLDDMNQDGVSEELLIPVSYYVEDADFANSNVGNAAPVDDQTSTNYLVGALAFVNLTSLRVYQTKYLDLTKETGENRAYLFASPTVADIDKTRPGLEIVVATSAGRLYLLDSRAVVLKPSPLQTGIIQSQVIVEDTDGSGDLKLIVEEVGGHVSCYDVVKGQYVWKKSLPGKTLTNGLRLVDIDSDSNLEIVVASDDGHLWMMSAVSGKTFEGWPLKVDHKLLNAPLITRLHGLDQTIAVVIGNDGGDLHAYTFDRTCQYHFALRELSLVSPVSHDLIPSIPGVELLIATKDGTLFCLSAGNSSDSDFSVDRGDIKQVAWPTELRTHNDFTFSEMLSLTIDNVPLAEVTSSPFTLQLTITDLGRIPTSPYACQVSIGSITLYSFELLDAGEHTVVVNNPSQPMEGHLVVECRNKHGKLLRDITVIRINKTFLLDLQWLLVGPTIAMLSLLLFLHGFPAADVLPVTITNKHR